MPEEPSAGLDLFIASRGLEEKVVALVYPDRRGNGFGLSRFRDHAGIDFCRISSHPLVHFAHARGFVAKTSANTEAELKELLVLSLLD